MQRKNLRLHVPVIFRKHDIQRGINKTEVAITKGTALKSNLDLLQVERLRADQRLNLLELFHHHACRKSQHAQGNRSGNVEQGRSSLSTAKQVHCLGRKSAESAESATKTYTY